MSSEHISGDPVTRPVINRAIRIFISCTYRDMECERKELEQSVFPRLRQLCEAHDVALESIDLGWGVSQYTGDPSEALSMCLSNICRCTYFIGILAEQYGTEFDAANELLLRQYPWLAERSGRSFVELECVYGVLGDAPVARHAFFYLRDSYANPAPRRGCGTLVSPHEESRSPKLAALKREIQESSALVREYDNLLAFAALVYEDLAAAIVADFLSKRKGRTHSEPTETTG